METWWFVIKVYRNGQWERFKLYSDEDTARRIGQLVNPIATALPDHLIIYQWKDNSWVDVSKSTG